MGLVWALGVSVYLYEPISCMTDPPMQWGYPRTVEGFFHALSRGQYGTGEGTNLFQDPAGLSSSFGILSDGLAGFVHLGLHVCRADSVSFLHENAQARTELDHRPGRDLSSASRSLLVIVAERHRRPFHFRIEQSLLHRVARLVRDVDRLWHDHPGRLCGHAL